MPDLNRLDGLRLDASAQEFSLMFRSPPEAAVAAWEQRVLPRMPRASDLRNAAAGIPNPSLPWRSIDILWHGHSRGFYVARMTRADILADIHAQVDRAIREGITFEQFKRDLKPLLKEKGWWSEDEPDQKSLVRNPQTGRDEWTRLGTTQRLRTIYSTNLRVSYEAGNYRTMESVSDLLPYCVYKVAGHGKNRRPTHQQLDGMVFSNPPPPSIKPPNGWGCKCKFRPITRGKARRMGATVPDFTPATQSVQIGGKQVEIEGISLKGGKRFFPEPQWAYDVSANSKAYEQLAWQKISGLPPAAQESFLKGIAKNPILLAQRTAAFQTWIQGVKSSAIAKGEQMSAGWMSPAIQAGVAGNSGIATVNPVLIIPDEGILHALRPGKAASQALSLDEAGEIPAIVANPLRTYWHDDALILYGPANAPPGATSQWFTRLVFKREKKTGMYSLVTAGKVNESALASGAVRIQ